MKTYHCAQWPAYSIRQCKFVAGLYQTDDPAEQALIESRPEFGVHIHLVPATTPRIETPTRARQGSINSLQV